MVVECKPGSSNGPYILVTYPLINLKESAPISNRKCLSLCFCVLP